MFARRPSRPSLLLILALGCFAVGAPGTSVASPQHAGLAEPSEDAWGDEWSDEASRRLAEETERRLLEEEARKVGGTVAAPREEQPPPTPAPATTAPPEAAAADEATEEDDDDALVRALAPPSIGFDELHVRWAERRAALARGDAVEVAAQEARLAEAMRILDVAELDAFSAAAVRESESLVAIDPKLALARADLAVSLAPSLPAAHLARARALFADEPWSAGAWGEALLGAVAATVSHERHLRPLLLDLGVAAGIAIFGAGALCLLWFALRSGRLFLHDFGHLLPKRATGVQALLLALIVLALPLVFGLGPVIFAATLTAALWLYLGRGEQIVIGAWLVLLGLAPAGAGWIADRTAWSGTPASVYDRIDRAGDFGPLPSLEEAVLGKDARPEDLFVLGRVKKRGGAWDEAGALFERALALRPGWPSAEVALGNVRFLQGDLEAARRHYDRAVAADPELAAAWFSLSRLHYRTVDFAAGQAARERAVSLDRGLVARYGQEEESSGGNWYLADPALSRQELASVASRSGEGDRVFGQVAAALLPFAPRSVGIWIPAIVVLVLGWVSTQRRNLHPSSSCVRCGRAVCLRCDPESKGGQECGQCVHVYRRRGVVDPGARARKEAAVWRHRERRVQLLKVASVVLAGPIVAGKIGRGVALVGLFLFLAALVWMREGVARPVFGGVPPEWKTWTLGVPLVALYLVGLRAGWKAEE
ncbi:MAG TPA: tetratricopeptide repeat protein [Vulgatibacter sp.]|nr:tetratricopeptide repeat protein [Vulgatibacter sp.]